MLRRLRERNEFKCFGVLPKADLNLAIGWWVVLVLRGMLPAVFAIAMGRLVGAVQNGSALAAPLAFVGAVFVLLQVLTPIHQTISANLGDRTADMDGTFNFSMTTVAAAVPQPASFVLLGVGLLAAALVKRRAV